MLSKSSSSAVLLIIVSLFMLLLIVCLYKWCDFRYLCYFQNCVFNYISKFHARHLDILNFIVVNNSIFVFAMQLDSYHNL